MRITVYRDNRPEGVVLNPGATVASVTCPEGFAVLLNGRPTTPGVALAEGDTVDIIPAKTAGA